MGDSPVKIKTMKKEELIVGNKYIPLKKSTYGNLDESSAWKNAQKIGQNFLYLTRIDFDHVVLNETMSFTGDYFLPEDIIPYEEIPEKWYIKITKENKETIEQWLGNHNFNLGTHSCVHYDKNACDISNVSQFKKGATEITFEQFQTHILKQNNMKKIIGYKLKDNLWIGDRKDRVLDGIAKVGLIFTSSTEENINQVMFRMAHPAVIENYKAAGVLDVWFTPIYEDDKVEIGSYVAKKDGFNVAVGCQTYTKDTLLVIQSLLKRETKHEVKVDGINITLEHINKLLALLNT